MSNIAAINNINDMHNYIRDSEESSITSNKVLDWLINTQQELLNN